MLYPSRCTAISFALFANLASHAVAVSPEPGKAILAVDGIETHLHVFPGCKPGEAFAFWAVEFYDDEPGTPDPDGVSVQILGDQNGSRILYTPANSDQPKVLTDQGALRARFVDRTLEYNNSDALDGAGFNLKATCK